MIALHAAFPQEAQNHQHTPVACFYLSNALRLSEAKLNSIAWVPTNLSLNHTQTQKGGGEGEHSSA